MNPQVEAFRTLLEAQESDTYTEELELACIRAFPGELAEALLEAIEIDGDEYYNKTDEQLDAILDELYESTQS